MHHRQRRGLVAVAFLLLAVVAAACDSSDPFASVGQPTGASPSAPVVTSPSVSASVLPSTPTAAPTKAPRATPRPSATPKPVASVKGTGFTDSKTFRLAAGTYVVRWTVTSKDSVGCTAIGAIHTPDGAISRDVASTTLTGKGTKSGAKTVTNLAAGTYVVTFATTCAWTADVYPT